MQARCLERVPGTPHQHGLQKKATLRVARPRTTTVRAALQQNKAERVEKGISLLEWTNKLLPQSQLVSAVKFGWRLAWQIMVRELAPQTKDGAYKRPSYKFTGRIGDSEFPAESGRYHLYLGNACPWCHRVHLALVLRGLLRPVPGVTGEHSSSGNGNIGSGGSTGDGRTGSGNSGTSTSSSSHLDQRHMRHVCSAAPGQQQGTHLTITQLLDDPTKARRGGWVFSPADPDPVWGAKDLWEVYDTASPGFKGRCTAPLLVDKVQRRIVSNESADIVRMLNDLHLPGCTDVDLAPAHLLPEIDALNEQIYESVNNGVYRSGFSTSQAAYDTVQADLYRTLDDLEQRLSQSRFLLGDKLTEADVRLLPTTVRFDAVYANIFRCTRRRIRDYPHLSAWMKDMWQLQVEGSTQQVSDTVDIDAARASYYTNLFPLSPSGIIPSGPTAADLQLDAPHGRGSNSIQEACYKRG